MEPYFRSLSLMKNKILKLLFILAFFSSLKAQTFDPILGTKLQNTIDSLSTTYNIKGISASVIYPGQGMWQGISGYSYSGVPINSSMVFGLGSNTKLFTAVLMLQLIQSNVVRIDDSLYQWLPNFNNVDSNITIRQLLNHTSGLADVNNVPGYADSILNDPNRIYSPAEVMTWVGTQLFAPGTSWSYSNTNYLLAGMIIESATGYPYGKMLHDSILSPLNLDSTFLDVYDNIQGTVAHPWQNGVDKNSIPRTSLNSASWTAGGMYSTSSEMAQWYQALMSGQVLNPTGFDLMTTFVGTGNYGCGLFEMDMNGSTVWEHGGTIWGGYNTQMIYDTSSKVIICVLVNANPAPAFNVGKQLHLTIQNNPISKMHDITQDIEYSVFPNPASNNVCVKSVSGLSELLEVEITDAGGRIIGNEKVSIDNGRGEIMAMRTLENGMYIIRLFSENRKNIQMMKIVKSGN